ncbi:MAG TPA: hypothetical protein VF310_05705 [Vicinamibacteria bacterium]
MQEERQATADGNPSGAGRPAYEPPRIQVMTEKEILASFQITQSMVAWWQTGMC